MHAQDPSAWEAPKLKRAFSESVPSYSTPSFSKTRMLSQCLPTVSEATDMRREEEPIALARPPRRSDDLHEVTVVHRHSSPPAEPFEDACPSRSPLAEYGRKPFTEGLQKRGRDSSAPQAMRGSSSSPERIQRTKSTSLPYSAPGSAKQLATFCEEELARSSRARAASAKSPIPKSITPAPHSLVLSVLFSTLSTVISQLSTALALFFSQGHTANIHDLGSLDAL